jgi:DNA-binding NarL/FixJ family response regulator
MRVRERIMPEQHPITVLLFAAYAAIRAGLGAMLSEWNSMDIAATAGNLAELETALLSETPDIVVCDLSAFDEGEVLRFLAARAMPAVIMADTPDILATLAQAGLPCWAAICKNADTEEIVQAIHTVHAGLIAADQSLLLPVLRGTVRPNAAASSTPLFPEERLTPREQEVLQLMAEGLPNKIIAARLKVSLHTAKFHVASILAKLGASSRTEAVTLGARRGDILL